MIEPYPKGILRQIGVYGFDDVEELILISLITCDPILLIGKSGTGKTFLLNSLSEILGLNHKHFNASMISFDDLVGFPMPEDDKKTINYIPTPSTIWGAESILIDEISRCKPEVQNKFFSIINERKIQGLPLENLLYRWAAMNPSISFDDESYMGSEILDYALADRFSMLIEVPDWNELEESDKYLISNPAGLNKINSIRKEFISWIDKAKERFLELLKIYEKHLELEGNFNDLQDELKEILTYSVNVADALNSRGIRFSPRRTLFLSRNILAYSIINNTENKYEKFYTILKNTIILPAIGVEIKEHIVAAANRTGLVRMGKNVLNLWLEMFINEKNILSKIGLVFTEGLKSDVLSIGIIDYLRKNDDIDSGIFVYALTPYLIQGEIKVSDECMQVMVNRFMEIAELQAKLRSKSLISNCRGMDIADLHDLIPAVNSFVKSEIYQSISNIRKKRSLHFLLWVSCRNFKNENFLLIENRLDRAINMVLDKLNGGSL